MEEKKVNIFEFATRTKMRFEYRGILSVEDLWDLSLTGLDTIYKQLNAKKKLEKEDSLLTTTKATAQEVTLEVAIEIVKYIAKAKQDEANAAKLAAAKRMEKQRLLEILANKKDTELQGKSIEEIEKMIAELS